MVPLNFCLWEAMKDNKKLIFIKLDTDPLCYLSYKGGYVSYKGWSSHHGRFRWGHYPTPCPSPICNTLLINRVLDTFWLTWVSTGVRSTTVCALWSHSMLQKASLVSVVGCWVTINSRNFSYPWNMDEMKAAQLIFSFYIIELSLLSVETFQKIYPGSDLVSNLHYKLFVQPAARRHWCSRCPRCRAWASEAPWHPQLAQGRGLGSLTRCTISLKLNSNNF